MPNQPEPRRVARQDLPTEVQIQLLNSDADATILQMKEMEERIGARLDDQDARIGKILWTLVTMVITLATSIILFAANLITGSI